jgi:hypothetical protein
MGIKVAVILDSSREFRVSTLDLNHGLPGDYGYFSVSNAGFSDTGFTVFRTIIPIPAKIVSVFARRCYLGGVKFTKKPILTSLS